MPATLPAPDLVNFEYRNVQRLGTNSKGQDKRIRALVRKSRPWAKGVDMFYDYQTGYGNVIPGNFSDTHAQDIMAQRLNGSYQSFAANVPVITNLGLQTVPTRTNSIRNNTMQGASAGVAPTNWASFNTETGIAKTVIGTGTEDGLPYIDVRFAGTAPANGQVQIAFEPTTQIVCAENQVWTLNFDTKLVAGIALSNARPSVNLTTAAGAYVNESALAAITIDGTKKNLKLTHTVVGATSERISPWLKFNVTSGQVIDATIRIYAPQLELGAFATPPILTTGAAATVNGNQQVYSGLGAQLVNGMAGFIDFDSLQPVASGEFPVILDFNNGAGSNRFAIFRTVSSIALSVFNGGTNQGGPSIVAPATPFSGKLVFAVANGFQQLRLVGGGAAAATTGAYPGVTPDRMAIAGRGYSTADIGFQRSRKLAIKYGPQDQASFDKMYALAVIASNS